MTKDTTTNANGPDMASGGLVRAPENRSAEIMRSARLASGLTVAQVAELANVSRSTVARYEHAGVQPTSRSYHVFRVASVVGVSLESLVATVRGA